MSFFWRIKKDNCLRGWYNDGIIKPLNKGGGKMPQIIPIKELKNTAEISKLVRAADEPIYITKNGYGDMVIMSVEMYENTMKRLNMYRELELSEREIESGKIKDARQALGNLKEKYDL